MAKQSNPDQFDLFDDWLVVGAQPIIPPTLNSEATLAQSFDEPRHILALRLSQKLNAEGEITTQFLTEAANQAFGGTQAQGTYSTKDAYDALEAAFNIHLLSTEDSGWTEQGAEWARTKAIDLTSRIQKLPTQTKRDEEMDEFQQFSTPPALSFVANWVANVKRNDVMVEPSAGTGDLAVWPEIAGAVVILNELAPRRQALLSALFPKAQLFKENAEQLDNVLPIDIAPTVIVMNPPFSSTAGRVHGQRDTTNGARHIEQALKRLEDGGRLVAIVGNGMAADRPAFSQWWKDIEKKYNVRANVGISGKEYAKYGTSFDNQILVIDKTGATTQPVLTGKVESVADLPTLLEGIRNDRQRIQSNITKPAVKADTRSKSDSVQPGNGIGGVGIGKDGARTQSIRNRADSGAITTDSKTSGTTTVGDVLDDGIGAGDGIRVNPIGDVGGSGGRDTGGNSGVPKSDSPRGVIVRTKAEEDHLFDVLLTTLVVDKKAASTFSQTTGVIIGTANQNDQALKQWRKEQRKLKPEQRFDVLGFIPDDLQRLHKVGRYAENPDSQTSSSHQDGQTVTPPIAVEVKNGNIPEEFTDSVFANYTPQRLTIQGAQQHPGKLVQSAAMSAVEPPPPSYAPVLPTNLIKDGLLSIAQLEAVVYAGQAHSELLPNGSRKGFFIGDGTGVGKGREISGIILDNMMQGRNKAVWISFNEGLIEDAKRDFAGIGGDPGKIFFQGKTKAGNEITQEDGILFTTYSTLRGGEKKQANDLGQEGGKTRAQQIINWLGEDFDGVIAFDEAHSMGNAIAVKGKRGVRKPSQQAIAGINLQRELPNARITYVSATGATEVSNLSYADRLGLWGEGTPFADVNTFIAGVTKGGIASMELISRDMKAMGMYLARSLSYDGVSYERLEHTLSDFQEAIYNELAGAWQIVLNNVEQALEITQAGSSGNAKSAAMAQFWGAHQRFFNQIITAMQTPRVIDDIREQLEAGHVAVIQLVNTNEAAQERIIADATAHNTALEDLDFTPRQMLMDYVRNGFPVAAYEESKDDNGNTIYVPVRDSEGNPVFDREAIALRDALLETLQQIRVPENPLDSIINAFGSDRVAEITGRSRRFVQTRDDDGNYQMVEEKRGKNSARADAEAFQANKKDILVFSGAGGTGYSFHADNTAANQRKRIHYILQPGWRADAAVQGFGRTHRTNQANAPHYVLPTTNLKAQKRFVSSIARRLDQLGALTRGQREATSQDMFTAADNLESHYATLALNNFFTDLYRGKTDLSFHDVTKQMGLNLLDDNGALSESKMPGIPQFLNRLLSLKTDRQNAVFAEFENRLVEAVEYAKQQGLYDLGLQTLTAASIKKTRENVVYEDKQTGAQTRYVELAVTTDVSYYDWNNEVTRLTQRRQNLDDLSGWFVSEFGNNKGEVFFMSDLGGRLDSEGNAVRRGVIHTIKKNGHRYIDNADVISRGWDYRTVTANGVGSYQKVTLTRSIDKVEAEKLWHEQVANAPKTETRIERMIVGVILPIWDRVEGSETIKRLQTDEGEQLLGRMLGSKSAKQTLKNLGLDSGLSNRSASDLFKSIKDGNKAVLSNGWIIATARVNHESRIEIKERSSFTDAERRVLKDQGAFIERINWAERVFIPSGDQGLDVFKRITESKPVIDLLGLRNPIKQETDNEINKTTEPAETTGSDQSIFNTGGTNAPETGRERDLFPTSRLSGEKPTRGQYATETELISESRRLLTVGRITTVDQAAQAALSVSVQAVERFDALVTDKEGKPLAIVGSFKGTINSASVYPAVVAAEAFRIPDAANIYFYHNHPSGTTKLSDADLAITRKLQRVFDGSGITAHGIFAITTNGSFSYENPATREVVDGVAQAGAAAVSVPIIERIISFDEKMGAGVTSPDISKSLIPKLFNESGLMLLNNQHEPVGFMPMSPGEALPLKHTGMTDNLFRALSMSNAAAAILYDSEQHYSVEQYQNIGEFLDEIDISLLDVLVKQEKPNSSGASVMISGAELGWSFRSSVGVFLNDIPSISLVEKSNIKEVSQMSSLAKDKKAFHEMVAEKLIQQLKEGTAPWQKPWVPGESGAFLPYNPVTGNRYKGINSIYLLSQERDDQRWMTYKQATGLGGQVRKGEKGTGIHYWKFTEEHIKKDADGKPVLDSEGNPVKEVVRLERPRGFFAIVFNGEQIDGLPPIQKQEHTWDPIERVEGILTASGADIHHNGGSRAFYRSLTDSIHLPDKSQFPSAENYYGTALHELGHWTGKEDRLNRDLAHPFGSEGYAKEELRAEIASMILGDELGIGHDPSQHAAYVGSWIKALNDDPMEIFRAAADAEKIHNYVLSFEQEQQQEQVNDVNEQNLSEKQGGKMQTMQLNQNTYQTELARGNKEQVTYLVGSSSGTSVEYIDVLEAAQAFHDANAEQRPFVIRSENRLGGGETAVTIAFTSMVEHGGVKEYGKGMGDTDPAFKVAYDGISGQTQKPEKTYINVPFKEKEEAKALGAKWDRQEKSWYVPGGVNLAPFAKWEKPAVTAETDALKAATATESPVEHQKPAQERQYLAVPYGERAAAKASGAIWDKAAKSWYAGPDGDMAKLERWKPGNVPNQQGPAMRPEDEFAEALRALGCVVDGQHPIMDGAKHRIVVEGDKANSRERSGFYVGHLDGHPAGYIKNNRTGVDIKWKSKGYALDPEEKTQMQEEAAIKLRDREVALQTKQNAVAVDILALLSVSSPAPADHPYLQSKQVSPGDLRIVPPATTVLPEESCIIIGKDWKESAALREANPDKLVFTAGDLLVPAHDANGTVWTVQTIQSSGRKMFAKDSRKEDCFHVIGGFDALAKAPAIVIGEGFATAGSLSETLGFPTVSAFDSGNLVLVAKALHEKFPDKPIVIAGDDDKHLESTQGYNPGRSKANEAAKAVSGKVILPVFAPGEQAYPENLEPVTPAKARAGVLSDEQKEAITQMKSFTDFNDLATKSVLGKEGIERQVHSVVFSVIDKHQARIEQQHELVQQQEQRPRRLARI
ncbi:MAG: strawberry notch family protein [Methylococcaceae bacterium]|jgi:antirestriction protein ArdC/phage/plasmid primase-like uncharacterized protein